MFVHFYRRGLALSEYNCILNFCRVVMKKFGFNVRLRYGTLTVRRQVRWNYYISVLQIYEILFQTIWHRHLQSIALKQNLIAGWAAINQIVWHSVLENTTTSFRSAWHNYYYYSEVLVDILQNLYFEWVFSKFDIKMLKDVLTSEEKSVWKSSFQIF